MDFINLNTILTGRETVLTTKILTEFEERTLHDRDPGWIFMSDSRLNFSSGNSTGRQGHRGNGKLTPVLMHFIHLYSQG